MNSQVLTEAQKIMAIGGGSIAIAVLLLYVLRILGYCKPPKSACTGPQVQSFGGPIRELREAQSFSKCAIAPNVDSITIARLQTNLQLEQMPKDAEVYLVGLSTTNPELPPFAICWRFVLPWWMPDLKGTAGVRNSLIAAINLPHVVFSMASSRLLQDKVRLVGIKLWPL